MSAPARRSWRRVAVWAVQIAVVGGLCWLVFRNTDLSGVGTAFRQADMGLIALAALVMVAERIVRPYRLALLLGSGLRLIDIIGVQSVSQLVNIALPMRSGEVFLVMALRALGATSGSFALSIVAIDRLLDIVCVLLVFGLSVVAVIGLPAYVGDAAAILAAATIVVIAVMVGLALARTRALAFAERLFARFANRARTAFWLARLDRLIDGFAVLLDPRRLVPAVLATVATWGCAVFSAWLVMSAIWPDAPVSAASLAICLGVIGVTLVSVPAGIGILHAAFALAALAFGASQEVALAFALLEHFIPAAVTIAMGLISLPVARRAGLTLVQAKRWPASSA